MLHDLIGLDYLRDKDVVATVEDDCLIMSLKCLAYMTTKKRKNLFIRERSFPLVECVIEVRSNGTVAFLYGKEYGRKLARSYVSGWTAIANPDYYFYGDEAWEVSLKRNFHKTVFGMVLEECRKAMSELYGKSLDNLDWRVAT